MIGYLRGKILRKQAPLLLLDVNGVGFEIEATLGTFYDMPETGAEFALYTHFVVRDDAQLLFGFASEQERRLFRDLIKVNGVGAKLAVTLLSGMAVEDFVRCIIERDIQTLTRLPGVGKKTAERLIIEMRDRIDEQEIMPASGSRTPEQMSMSRNDPVADAVSALISLGYKPPEASRMIRAVATEGEDSGELIRAALQAAVV